MLCTAPVCSKWLASETDYSAKIASLHRADLLCDADVELDVAFLCLIMKILSVEIRFGRFSMLWFWN